MNNKKTKIWIAIFLIPSLIIFALFYLIPIVTVFITSFTEWDGFNSPSFNGLGNYTKLFFYDDTFLISIRNLLLWSLIAATIHVGFGTLIAFILYKKPFGWKQVRVVYMIPNVISLAAWAMIYKFIFNDDIGVVNTFVRALGFENFHVKWFYQSPAAFITITLTWVFYAVYVTLIVLGDLMSIPDEIHEAAKIDGASGFKITCLIDLPLIRKALGTGVILSVTSRIAMFEQITLTTRGGPGNDTYNIPLMLYEGIVNYKYGYSNAAAAIMIVLGIVVFVIVNKLFRMNESIY